MVVLRFSSSVTRLVLVLAVAVAAVTSAGLALAPAVSDLSGAAHGEAEEIVLDDLAVRSSVFAADGTLLATLREEENRLPVDLVAVPQVLIDAVLAVEDANFYDHAGVNARATIRALLSNVESGEITGGGSTITQQLVKQSLLTTSQDLDRKTREAFLAIRLEKQMSKDDILERYLNTIYLGNHSYGVQAAAETYFGKQVSDIGLAESALLAGMIRNPIDYDPFKDQSVAAERRRIALKRMVEENLITQAEADEANQAPLPDAPIEFTPPPDDYFVEEVKRRLLDDDRLGDTRTERFEAIFRGGLHIHTTLDLEAQAQAEAARDEVVSRFAIDGETALFVAGRNSRGDDVIGTVGIAAVEPSTGAVQAMVGGPGFGPNSQLNMATQAYKQPGSSFKVLVLLSLLEQGRSPNDTVSGTGPCTFKIPGVAEPYEAQNFGNSSGFTGSIRSMTTASSNCGYLRLGQIAGIDDVVELSTDLGLLTRNSAGEVVALDDTIFSTPLGVQGVTPLAMSGAFAAIANGGYYNPPYFVSKVVDQHGRVVFEHTDEGHQAFSADTAAIAADILRANVTGGTGTAARVLGHDVGGKTGTAQDYSNGWFVGFSAHLSVAVWMGGIDENVPMRSVGGRSVTGGSWPATIFGNFMNRYLENRAPIPFPEPPSRRSTGVLRVDPDIDLTPSTTRPPPPPPDTEPEDTPSAPEGGD